MNMWLLKSEPDVFSIDDLKKKGKEPWNGVRNYQARNYLRDMRPGDLGLFYHSNAEQIGVVGVMEVLKLAEADPTQFDARSEYFDAGAKKEAPRWDQVLMGFKEKFPRIVTLEEMRGETRLSGLALLRKGNRLSVLPVAPAEFKLIVKLAHQ